MKYRVIAYITVNEANIPNAIHKASTIPINLWEEIDTFEQKDDE